MLLPRAVLPLLFAAAVAASGCAEDAARPSGRAFDRGTPIEGALVRFETSCDGGHCTFDGVTDAEGRYRLDYGVRPGIPPGRAEATVSRALLPDGSPLPPGEEGAFLLETGRARRETYRFDVDLDAGSQTVDFDLADGERVPG